MSTKAEDEIRPFDYVSSTLTLGEDSFLRGGPECTVSVQKRQEVQELLHEEVDRWTVNEDRI